jgi:hypothetical protein
MMTEIKKLLKELKQKESRGELTHDEHEQLQMVKWAESAGLKEIPKTFTSESKERKHVKTNPKQKRKGCGCKND